MTLKRRLVIWRLSTGKHLHFADQFGYCAATYCTISASYRLLTRVDGGDVSAHRCGLIGSCSSSVQYLV